MRLVIDARKAFDSGIGTYIRNVLPRVLRGMGELECTVLLQNEDDSFLHDVGACRLTRTQMSAAPFSFAEQLELRRHIQAGSIFWATSLAHPLFTNRPMLVTVHDVAQLALPGKAGGSVAVKLASWFFLKSILTSAQHILFNSNFTHNEFEYYVGCVKQLSTVTPLGVDPNWFIANTIVSRTQINPYFICVGNVRPHKNLQTLICAFDQISSGIPHDLAIVGEHQGFRTNDIGMVKQLTESNSRIKFLGRLSDSDLRQWVANAEAMIFPSLYEGFGLPAIEAMAAGCLVISSTAGALQEVCGDAAQYFNPLSSVDLSRVMLKNTYMATEKRISMVTAGKLCAKQFTWDRTADLTIIALQKLLNSTH